jgi:plastocyanin
MMSIRAAMLAAVVAASLVASLHAQPSQPPQAPAPHALPASPATSAPATAASPAQPAASATTSSFMIVIEHYGFSPKRLAVPQGAIVTWINRDGIRHDATAVGQWTTRTIMSGQSGSITAAKAGTFEYKCTVHPDMHGTLVVEAAK